MNPLSSLVLAASLLAPISSAAPNSMTDLAAVRPPSATSARAVAKAVSDARPLFEVTAATTTNPGITLHAGQMNKPFLLTATIATSLGAEIRSGDHADNFLIAFRRVGDAVQVFRLNTDFRAAPGTPEAVGVKARFPDSPLVSVGISTENPAAGYVVIPAKALFLADLTDVKSTVAEGFKGIGGISVNDEMTRLDKIEALHSNLDAQMTFVFEPGNTVQVETIPDGRKLPVAVRYSLSALPDDGFKAREADPRIGYFTVKYHDYSNANLRDKADPVRRLITKWRLEKVDPAAPVSDVKKPIVWWLDPAMPQRFRAAARAGVLAWNEAFEALGFRNALVVKDVDKDMTKEERARFNPNDAAYNMVRWFLDTDVANAYSYGPSRVNPLTGEIYSATVFVSDIMTRLWEVAWKPDLAAALPKDLRPDPAHLAVILARGLSPEEKERFIQTYITGTITHEIGHTLGLRHNFKGSSIMALKDLGKNGLLSSSIMDYTPPNYLGAGRPGAVYNQTVIGPYDRAAIAYGYSRQPDGPAGAQALDAIARSAPPYGTDEDVTGIDPDAQRWLLSREIVKYSDIQIDQAQNLWKRGAVAGSPEILPPADVCLKHGLSLCRGATASVLPLIGGVRSDRRAVGEPSTFKPVPAAEQLQALDFLDRRVFARGAFSIPSELVLHAVPDPMEAAAGHGLPDVSDQVLAIQRSALDHLYDPATLQRIALAAQYQSTADRRAGKPVMTMAKVFVNVRKSIWSELQGEGPLVISPMRRRLQRAHIDELMSLAQKSSARLDAVSLARQELSLIAAQVKEARDRAKDPVVRAHMDEMLRLAQKLDTDDSFKDRSTTNKEDGRPAKGPRRR